MGDFTLLLQNSPQMTTVVCITTVLHTELNCNPGVICSEIKDLRLICLFRIYTGFIRSQSSQKSWLHSWS